MHICASALAQDTRAADETSPSPRIAVYVEGANRESVREALVRSLPPAFDVIPEVEYRAALTNARHYGEMGARLWWASGAQRTLFARIADANRRAKVKDAIIARTRRTRTGGSDVWIVLFVGGRVELEQAIEFQPNAIDESAFRAALAPGLQPAVGEPPAVSPVPTEGPQAAEAPRVPAAAPLVRTAPDRSTQAPDGASRAPTDHPARTVIAGIGFIIAGRRVTYHAPRTRNLRPYGADFVPAISAGGEVYPAARMRIPVLQDAGIIGGYARSFSYGSAVEGTLVPSDIDTWWDRFWVGGRARIRLLGDRLELGLTGQFARHRDRFDAAGRLTEQLPSVEYEVLRPGLDARYTVGRASAVVAGGYQLVLDAGELAARFREPQVHGFDVSAGVGFAASEWLELRLGVHYEGCVYSFASQPGDEFAADGAFDHRFRAQLGPFLTL
jgi:hypothetical protein